MPNTPCGENTKTAKLTDDDVRDMRRKYKQAWPIRQLAEYFGVSKSQVSRICNYQSWKHVQDHD